MYLVFVMYALFGSVFTIGKQSLIYAHPFFIVGSRMLFAGLLMFTYQAIKNRQNLVIDSFTFWRLLLLAVFNIFLTNTLEFWGLKYLSSSKACLLYSVSPFISALLSFFILSETLSKRKWFGLCAGFIGFLPILSTNNVTETPLENFFYLSWPELALLGAASSSVYGWILIRQLVSQRSVSPITINAYSMFFGGIMTLVLSYIIEGQYWKPFPVSNYSYFFVTALALLIISNIICYNLYAFLLKRYTATFMSFAGFSTPIFAALFGWAFHHETITWHYWVSLCIVFTSLSIFHKEEIKSFRFNR